MTVQSPPVCPRCSEQPESLDKLEQHVRASQSEPEVIKAPANVVNGQNALISLSQPLDSEANKAGEVLESPIYGEKDSLRRRRRSTLPAITKVPAPVSMSSRLPVNEVKSSHIKEEPFSILPKSDKRVTVDDTPPVSGHDAVLDSAEADAFTACNANTKTQIAIDRRSSDLMSTSTSRDTASTNSKEAKPTATELNSTVKRENSVIKRRRSPRKQSTVASTIATTKDKPPEPGSMQDTVPTRRSIVKELANFFSSGTSKT
ncbi:hypothetical protein PV08_05387 [Exophiala spinifera]|uniref:Uncharacterized protein n=1 Tax=Exophiala spinifera TaxID=91928 RepID=A0A0D1YK30_9EURO|nr:uncharacterized protein PV08_05387 [Exophiala spinifera]KIW15341.1 hypothetical protein PV08_05387 [Exophiala spinifera]